MMIARSIPVSRRSICLVQSHFSTSEGAAAIMGGHAAAITKGTMDKVREQVHPTIKGRRRFYKNVGVRRLASSDDGPTAEAFEVLLDGRALKTPGRRSMYLPTEGLAWGVAAEWDAQTGQRGIEPSTMPLMSLAATWLDQTAEGRELVVKNVFKYLHTDTVCFYAEPVLRVLRKRQTKAFRPLHEWMADDWGCDLATSNEVFRLKHPAETVTRVKSMVNALDDAALTALQCATMETKSLVLALALVLRKVAPRRAEEACRLEEEFQMEQWGLVEGGHDMDRVAGKVQVASASAFLHLLDGEEGHATRLAALRGALSDLEK